MLTYTDQVLLARGKKRYSGAGWALLTMVVTSVTSATVLSILMLLAGQIFGFDPYGNPLSLWLLGFGPVYLVGLPLGIAVLQAVPKCRYSNSPLGTWNFFKYLLMCFAVSFVGSIVGNLLAALFSFGQAENPLDQMLEGLDYTVLFSTLVLAPVLEELVFRKFLLDRLSTFGETTAILFSALAFSMFHANLYQMVYAFGIGVIFAYVYTRTRRIRYTMAMHFIINFLGSVVAPLALERAGDLNYLDAGVLLANASRLVPLLLYEVFTLLTAAAGTVLLAMNWKKARFYPGGDQLPRGLGGKAAYGTAGVILFLVVCGIETLYTLVISTLAF